MGKKKKKKIIPNPIDCIPKYSQQPRSSPPKRRTDFSGFTCTPSLLNPDSQERNMKVKQSPDVTLVQCSYSQGHRSACSSEFSDILVMQVGSYVHDEGLNPGISRDASNEKTDIFKMSQYIPKGSNVYESNSLVSPGNVVWARTASQMWWPAEIMKERSTLSDLDSAKHVLVQFYGNHSSAWINPLTDISPFEDSFEERSTNPSRHFHQALKEALQRKEQLSSCRKLSSDRCSRSKQQNHPSDKRTSCASSTTVNDFLERGRGKRERKRKVHFDEVKFPLKSEGKARRLKIMRYLGLVAPVGSPF